MNIVAFDKAYCLYPRATLCSFSLLVTNGQDADTESTITEFSKREYKITYSLTDHWQQNHPIKAFRSGVRFVEDYQTWGIPLDLTGVTMPDSATKKSKAMTTDPVAGSSWMLWRDTWGVAWMNFTTMRCANLFYNYVYADHQNARVIGRLMWGCDAEREMAREEARKATPEK